jgi:hypothetical protein
MPILYLFLNSLVYCYLALFTKSNIINRDYCQASVVGGSIAVAQGTLLLIPYIGVHDLEASIKGWPSDWDLDNENTTLPHHVRGVCKAICMVVTSTRTEIINHAPYSLRF